jgi:hypothetical protein
MKIREVTAGGNTITLKTMSAGKYYDLLDEYRANDNWARYSQNIIFQSIADWDFKNESGAKMPITKENFNSAVGTDALNILAEAALDVNGLSADEKKTLPGQSAAT